MKARIPGQSNMSQANMMKKIQEMQNEMARVQQEVEEAEYSATVGGGTVSVTVNGKHEVQKINIKPDVVDPEDIEMLEDLITAAFNEAIRKANDTMENEMNKVTGGLNIPGMPGGLF